MAGNSIFTIPAGIPFADALAAGLMERIGPNPAALADVRIYLANQRAVTTVRDAFLRHGDGRALLLPELRALGEVDEAEEISLVGPSGGLAGEADLAPAISPVRRQLLLTRLVERFTKASGIGPGRGDLGQAARLAGELAALLDSLQIEEVPFAALHGIVPDRYAAHWQRTLEFLEIVGAAWPAVLAEEGTLDPKDRRRRLIDAQIQAWRDAPPEHPVIVAGSTGSQPATARLIETVAGLPRGMVILPGLDQESDDESFIAVAGDPTHPQHGLVRLIARLGVTRGEVRPWHATATPLAPARRRLLAEVMRPAESTDRWRRLAAEGTVGMEALDGLTLIDCPDARAEAQVIALQLREALEDEDRTAALVTPDRTLARRVAVELRRWGIDIDDSAGRPLADTPTMAFWRITAEAVAKRLSPSTLLAALKHPLAAGGLSPGEFRRRVRLLERQVLRGPRPAPAMAGLIAAVEAADMRETGADRGFLLDWLAAFAPLVEALESVLQAGAVELTEIVDRHMALCGWLAATTEMSGDERLWRREEGEAAADFLHEVMIWADGHPPIAGADYLPLLDALIEGRSHRRRWGGHPRISILGLIEARLQRFDLTILGGLNEGMWPPEAPVDPWLSRPMRETVGLPPPERRIGLTAHDFTMAASAPEIVLTRAERVDGAPTVPSRWLLRLRTVLEAVGLSGRIDADAPRMLSRATLLDRPNGYRPAAPPMPRPPLDARPRELSVTQIETLMRDPYAIYARKVLSLEALDPLDADPGAADRGRAIHDALDRFARAHPDRLPPDALDRLLEIGETVFEPLMARPDVWAFWWPRFTRIARWVVEVETGRRPGVETVATEQRGETALPLPGGPFTIKAFADRIDRLVGGGYAVIDYKTGGVPRAGDVESGLSPQLPLEALILEAGGFPALPAGACAALEYWQLSGGAPAGRVVPVKGEPGALAAAARDGLTALITAFDDPATPYLAIPDPELAPRFNDYAHLERLAEWATVDGDGA